MSMSERDSYGDEYSERAQRAKGYSDGYVKGFADAKKKFDRPHGEWVRDFNKDSATVCSECGEKAWYKEYCGWVTKSNFCPTCGADMRKEGDEK